ncbi:regulator of G-protein signaling 18 [Trichosurus vulpecula]|uniref:regulator of G-protein signaling 18 n=1 Tax=Trichosurus vulpecula TaxID=9337 RepID=UPI00186ADAF2|nr:regulator of G-protein signaling 18 [Trichosurus vulpecula]
MEKPLVFFSQLNMSDPKEKIFFKAIHTIGKEALNKDIKNRGKEKKNRISLLLQKPEFHEDVSRGRSENLAKGTSVSPEEAVKWGESFDKLLSHKDGFNAFTRFLKTEFSEENIEFWAACEDFKKSQEPHQLFHKAQVIYEKFIQNDAPQEVNLDFHTKEIIFKSISQPTIHSFDAAQSRVYQLMEQDSYTRFLRSDIYLDLINGRPLQTTNLRRRSRSFTFNEFPDEKPDFAIWL